MTDPAKDRDLRQGAGPDPLIFGVSGHRDLVAADLPELRSQIEIVFSRFRSAYPDISFELLSPLAEGADRLAAEVAVACGIKLVVPMPMSQAEYERDFTEPASLVRFRHLLSKAERAWQIPSGSSPGEQALGSSDSRTEKYAAVGDYIARKSHVLILLWDGCDNEKVGGTAWVKKRRESWIKAAREGVTEPDSHGYLQTIQIVTPRASAAERGQERQRVEIIGDLPDARS